MAKYDYDSLAERAILDLIRSEYAVTVAEMEARISDHIYPGVPTTLQPHVLTTARNELLRRRRIARTTEQTHGGHTVTVYHAYDQKGVRSKIKSAAERKRSLSGSLQGWATATRDRPQGLLGPGGEFVVLESLRAASIGALLNPQTGGVPQPLGYDVGGPIDNGLWVTVLGGGRPVGSVFAPIEVKNVRHWLYPWHPETYQLLHKAARLQELEPDLDIAPVLICRARQFQLDRMSRQLGFRVMNTRSQYLAPDPAVKEDTLEAIRQELGFDFLELAEGADPDVTRALRSLPGEVEEIAASWQEVGSHFIGSYEALRDESLKGPMRSRELDELKELVADHTGDDVRW